MASSKDCPSKQIVIIGGGAIGVLTAYYLSIHPSFSPNTHSITLLEATSIASGSSGRAAGMIGSWATPPCIGPLSFSLHAQLAEQHGGEEWGYRRVECAEIRMHGLRSKTPDSKEEWEGDDLPQGLDWIPRENVYAYLKDGGQESTGQIMPLLFVKKMLALAQERGVKVIIGAATKINAHESGHVESVTYQRKREGTSIVPATNVVLAAGPWTGRLLPGTSIDGSRSHSLVVEPTREISPYVLCPTILKQEEGEKTPPWLEIYPRPDNTAFCCGVTDYDVPLPPTSDGVQYDQKYWDEVWDGVERTSVVLGKGKITKRDACYRPYVTGRERDSRPLLGFTHTSGLLIAAGHDEWGMQNSAATGKVVSELIFDGEAKSADISSLDPRPWLAGGGS